MRLIALDPGVGTGYAVFDAGALHGVGTWRKDHANALGLLLTETPHSETLVYVEEPGTYGYHGRMKPRSHQKLQQTIGLYLGVCSGFGVKAHTIPVSEWKGNEPKPRTRQRMLMLYGKVLGNMASSLDSNAFDALGLGHYMIGTLAFQARVEEATRNVRPRKAIRTERSVKS